VFALIVRNHQREAKGDTVKAIVRKPLRVSLNLTMREAGVLHEILAIIEGGDIEDIRRRNVRAGRIFNKLIKAEDLSLNKESK
jgi:hypothetical protein